MPVEELKAANDPRWQATLDGEWTSDETPDEFRARVLDAIERIVDAHAAAASRSSATAASSTATSPHVLGLADPPGFFYPNYTSIHRVAGGRQRRASIVTINETAHLRGTGLPIGLFQTG